MKSAYQDNVDKLIENINLKSKEILEIHAELDK